MVSENGRNLYEDIFCDIDDVLVFRWFLDLNLLIMVDKGYCVLYFYVVLIFI